MDVAVVADDDILVAENAMLSALVEVCGRYELGVNAVKREGKSECRMRIDGGALEVVNKFIYLSVVM